MVSNTGFTVSEIVKYVQESVLLKLQTRECAVNETMEKQNRVLIVGGTGYLGKRIVLQCLAQGLPTYVLMRPDAVSDINKSQLLISFKQSGAKLLQGSLDDHDSLVKALKMVDIVICTIGEDQLVKQLNLVTAIKETGNIKRFVPSEFGMDVDRMGHAMQEANTLFEQKRKVRRATEEAGIPFTFISANCLAGWFLSGLAQYNHFMPPLDKVFVYGDGNAKVIWVDEEDVAKYTVKAILNPETMNKTMYIRPAKNIMSLMEVVQTWERLSGRILQKIRLSEEDWLAKIKDETTPSRSKAEMAILYHIFYKGDLSNFDVELPNQCEATQLFQDVESTSVESYLRRFL